MSAPPPPRITPVPATPRSVTPVRPEPAVHQGAHIQAGTSNTTLRPDPVAPPGRSGKKRNHRGGKKKRLRRQSFAVASDDGSGVPVSSQSQGGMNIPQGAKSGFYRLQGEDLSNTSIESQALLDHRDQQPMRPRRSSTMGLGGSSSQAQYDTQSSYKPAHSNPFISQDTFQNRGNRPRTSRSGNNSHGDDNELDERAPLISSSTRSKTFGGVVGYGAYGSDSRSQKASNSRRDSSKSSRQSRKWTIFDKQSFSQDNYNVNNPPSVPGSPELGAADRDMSFGDMLVRDEFAPSRTMPRTGDFTANVDEHTVDDHCSIPSSPRQGSGFERRHTIALQAQEDVCFPVEGLSDIADEDLAHRESGISRRSGPRRRRGKWPDLSILGEWSKFEKEGRSEERRAKRITEPQLIGGRLRPTHRGWHRAEDDAPYRFTYFNEEFPTTIHSQTISELVQPGGSFMELFIPDPPELTDSDLEDEDEPLLADPSYLHHAHGMDGDSRTPTRQASLTEQPRSESRQSTMKDKNNSKENSADRSPAGIKSPDIGRGEKKKPKRYGERPTWWLDVLSPADAEMKVLSKTFGIHPLTAEDIMMQEPREKVELFRNYYFVNYRTFEQDINSENFLEPVNMYVVVFREGVLSFHFSMTPHPANVRRRIRQLKDYLILSSDWISYAIIDDITDVFAPLIQSIEDEVDDIDDRILRLHSPETDEKDKPWRDNEKKSDAGGDCIHGESGADMLRRVGDCRKKVMGLYRLLGNKADVIKGFAKRCNEHWEVAPRSEIGLYLGDIQDHIVTMTGNLSHYEKILARAHGNYLAQINIRMNERQEQTADVLGKLTVLGTIVLPMNIITGLWGMNVWVPGQERESDLTWFWCITAGLLCFGLACFYIAKHLYRIV